MQHLSKPNSHPVRILVPLLLAGMAWASAAFPQEAADGAIELPEITVLGQSDPFTEYTVSLESLNPTGPSAGDALLWVPGANVNSNGALTPIVQYRGLFGNRLNVLIDGVTTNSACPNEMEPPLHYMSIPRFDSVELHRGIAPVSSGLETLGTTLTARSRTLPFLDRDRPGFLGEVSLVGHSADAGGSVGGLLGISQRHHRLQMGGSLDRGADLEFGDGVISSSAYERSIGEIAYGFQRGAQELELAFVRNETEDTGTPALPMDIRYVDTDILRFVHRMDLGRWRWEVELGDSTVDHLMDNYSLRPPLNPQNRRFSLADSRSTTYRTQVERPWQAGTVAIGLDGNFTHNDARILSPDNAGFFVDNFNDVERARQGAFVEWRGPVFRAWNLEAGIRYLSVAARAGEVDGTPARMGGGAQVLRDRFNAADRSRNDEHLDLVLQWQRPLGENLTFEMGAARKSRSPSYQERFLWLPLESTAGLADGKPYVGNLELESERAAQFELGLEWRSPRRYAAPRVFYQRIADYIQGVPSEDPVVIAVSTANGDPTPLQYRNVEAELYGFDVPWAWQIHSQWAVEGIVNYVRGKRRDVDDDLFRIAPLNGSVALRYSRNHLAAKLESVLYAEQEQVSATNGESPSAGYQLLNLHLEAVFPSLGRDGTRVELGVNNLFDRDYRPHLNGVNRVRDSDVAIGERVPGAGRNVYARLTTTW